MAPACPATPPPLARTRTSNGPTYRPSGAPDEPGRAGFGREIIFKLAAIDGDLARYRAAGIRGRCAFARPVPRYCSIFFKPTSDTFLATAERRRLLGGMRDVYRQRKPSACGTSACRAWSSAACRKWLPQSCGRTRGANLLLRLFDQTTGISGEMPINLLDLLFCPSAFTLPALITAT